MASAIIHARDADEYNPLLMEAMLKHFPFEQPYFVTGYGYWSANDALALASFLDTVPICLFGNTADYLQLELDPNETELVRMLRQVLQTDEIGGLDQMRKSFPAIVT